MPKAILEFELPEENHEHRIALDGISYYQILRELDEYLRGQLKYKRDQLSDDTAKAYEDVRDKMNEFQRDHDVSIYQ